MTEAVVSRALHSVGQIPVTHSLEGGHRLVGPAGVSSLLCLCLSLFLFLSLCLCLSCRTIELFPARDKRSVWIKYGLAGTVQLEVLWPKTLFLASKFSENPTPHNTAPAMDVTTTRTLSPIPNNFT